MFKAPQGLSPEPLICEIRALTTRLIGEGGGDRLVCIQFYQMEREYGYDHCYL